MTEPVKPSRFYRSSLRDKQRADTRARVVDAAARLFIEGGYVGTSIAKVATEAGVSAETVYAIFGNKRELLHAVVLAAATGIADGGAMVDADFVDQVRAEPDQRRRFEMMTDRTRGTLRRVAPLDHLTREAAVADPEIAALLREHEAQRLDDTRTLVGLLAEVGPLRVSEREAAELMWALSRSTDLYRALTVDRRWSDARAVSALTNIIARTLFPDG